MNVAHVISESAKMFKSKSAILFEGRPYTFREIDDEIRKRALWLRQVGIRKGDRVAIQIPKSMDFVFLHLAILSIGAITLPLNPDYAGEEVAYFVSDSGTSLLITDAPRFEKIRDFLTEIQGLKWVLLEDGAPDGLGPLAHGLKKIGGGDPRTYSAQDDEVAMILYTSGTTGRSKGAMITHRNLVSNMMALKQAWEWTNHDVLLHVLPLVHVHGLCTALHGGLQAGSTIVIHERFDPVRTWETIQKEKCTMLMAVPTIYHRLINTWDRVKPDLSTMRVFISGSAPLSENLFHRFEEATGFRLLERYGMTEAGMIASNPINPEGRIPRSVGFPLPGVRIRIASAKGDAVEPGEVGEVWIQGENVFKGYWQRPEKTEESFHDGWFKTGDLGYTDPGDRLRLYLVGRAKEVIITGGYNVNPREVETVLERQPSVHEVAVIGVPDEDYGEKIIAFVVPKEGDAECTQEEMIASCKLHLAGYKCPKEIRFVDHIPRNTMGKIQKDLLQKKYSESAPDQMGAFPENSYK